MEWSVAVCGMVIVFPFASVEVSELPLRESYWKSYPSSAQNAVASVWKKRYFRPGSRLMR